MEHGLVTSYSATVIECTCGQTLIIRGSEGIHGYFGAHAQGDKPLHPNADRKQHAEDLKRIKLVREEK